MGNGGMLPGVLLGLWFLDSRMGGRRIQLIGAIFVMVPALVLAALASVFSWSNIIILVMVCVFGIGFQLAWGMIPWVYPSELFSMAEKGKAMSLAVFLPVRSQCYCVLRNAHDDGLVLRGHAFH